MAAKAKTKTTQKAGNLVIVESPAKAKTIEGYLGKDFKVVSCYGHIRDLPKNNHAIDIENGFKPTYEVSADKKEVIKELKKLAKTASLVYLASDDDREGEAISWHLKEALSLKEADIRRIVFREITKTAILKAIENPRVINQDLVNAQQARRILDRLVGFELSPLLWKKIKAGLSAGRVQSVAVRIVVEREREIEKFEPVVSFRTQAWLTLEKDKNLRAELSKRFKTLAEAQTFLEDCVKASFTIADLKVKEGKRSPSAPFTTSTLQQEASRRLGFSVARTMTLAQRLYEAGHISYMRTDSLNLSEEALTSAAQEITSQYGKEFHHSRRFKTKSDSAQEAHEAIRPSNFAVHTAGKDSGEVALYELIWKRAIASQMSEARIEKTTATISISTREENLTASGEVIRFEGFLKVYRDHIDEDKEEAKMLPPLNIGQDLPLETMISRESFTKPAARYTEASLVKQLEELGIGRPSTYAPTISTVQKRGYVIKESRDGKERAFQELTLRNGKVNLLQQSESYGSEKAKLFPTSLAKVVTDFLVEYFPNVIDYSFTAQVEKEFDDISQGRKAWNEMIADFYFDDFHPKIESTQEIDRSEVSGARELGEDPKTGKPVIARIGRFGPIVQIGSAEDEEKPRFAPLDKDQYLDTITLEQALELFKLPKTLGEYEDYQVIIGKGPFGPYIKYKDAEKDKFVSVPKEENPMSINLERAIELIEAKRQADAERFIKGFDEDPEIQILKGRWGPYIKAGKKNVRVPKDMEATDLSYEQVAEMVANAPEKRSRKAATKTTAKPAAKTKAKSTVKKTSAKTATKKATTVAKPKAAAKTTATSSKTVVKAKAPKTVKTKTVAPKTAAKPKAAAPKTAAKAKSTVKSTPTKTSKTVAKSTKASAIKKKTE